MVNFSLRRCAALLGSVFQGRQFMPHRARAQRAADLRELAETLLHVERQTRRARLEYLGRGMTPEQLHSVWRHRLEEVQALLHKAALPGRLQQSLLAERVRRALAQWEHTAHAACRRSLHGTELRSLEHRLEDLADALLVYAIAEGEQWCDTQPMS